MGVGQNDREMKLRQGPAAWQRRKGTGRRTPACAADQATEHPSDYHKDTAAWLQKTPIEVERNQVAELPPRYPSRHRASAEPDLVPGERQHTEKKARRLDNWGTASAVVDEGLDSAMNLQDNPRAVARKDYLDEGIPVEAAMLDPQALFEDKPRGHHPHCLRLDKPAKRLYRPVEPSIHLI